MRIFLEGCGGEVDFGDVAEGSDDSIDKDKDEEKDNFGKSFGTGHRKYCDLFKRLEEKFPSDPEHTSIRLVHLKFAYSFSHLFVTSAAGRNIRGGDVAVDEDRLLRKIVLFDLCLFAYYILD